MSILKLTSLLARRSLILQYAMIIHGKKSAFLEVSDVRLGNQNGATAARAFPDTAHGDGLSDSESGIPTPEPSPVLSPVESENEDGADSVVGNSFFVGNVLGSHSIIVTADPSSVCSRSPAASDNAEAGGSENDGAEGGFENGETDFDPVPNTTSSNTSSHSQSVKSYHSHPRRTTDFLRLRTTDTPQDTHMLLPFTMDRLISFSGHNDVTHMAKLSNPFQRDDTLQKRLRRRDALTRLSAEELIALSNMDDSMVEDRLSNGRKHKKHLSTADTQLTSSEYRHDLSNECYERVMRVNSLAREGRNYRWSHCAFPDRLQYVEDLSSEMQTKSGFATNDIHTANCQSLNRLKDSLNAVHILHHLADSYLAPVVIPEDEFPSVESRSIDYEPSMGSEHPASENQLQALAHLNQTPTPPDSKTKVTRSDRQVDYSISSASGECVRNLAGGEYIRNLVQALVKAGCNPNSEENPNGHRPLDKAARKSLPILLSALITAGAEINTSGYRNPLCTAVRFGNVANVELLLEREAHPNVDVAPSGIPQVFNPLRVAMERLLQSRYRFSWESENSNEVSEENESTLSDAVESPNGSAGENTGTENGMGIMESKLQSKKAERDANMRKTERDAFVEAGGDYESCISQMKIIGLLLEYGATASEELHKQYRGFLKRHFPYTSRAIRMS